MASKRKTNGCTSVRRVEEAVRKCGCSINEFFRRAMNMSTVHDFDVDAATKKFLNFQKYGSVANSHYGIPSFVIIFAVKVLGGERPHTTTSRKGRDRNHTRPSIATGRR